MELPFKNKCINDVVLSDDAILDLFRDSLEFLEITKFNILLCGPKMQIILVKLPFKNTAKIIHRFFQFDKQ